MGLFSGLKRLFGCSKCNCNVPKTYTQIEVDDMCTYWTQQIEKAKILANKNHSVTIKTNVIAKRNSIKRSPPGHEHSKLLPETKKLLKKALNKFVKDVCLLSDGFIHSDLLLDVYTWWCKKNNYPHYYGKVAIGRALRKRGVMQFEHPVDGEGPETGRIKYHGIKINPSVYEEYLMSKKTQTTHVAQSGAPVVCRNNGELF